MAVMLNLNKTVDEAKREAGGQLILNLNKAGADVLGKPLSRADARSRVCLILDVSGSTEELYKNKLLSLITTMVGGVALNLDDNGDLDVMAFDSSLFDNLPGFTASNADTYIDRYVFDTRSGRFLVGGRATQYAKPLRALVNKYKAGDPVFAIFVTDGENQDQADALEALVDLSYYGPIFVQTVGVGYGLSVKFENLQEMNGLGVVNPGPGEDRGPRYIDNAGFCTVDFKHATEQQVYDALLNEYPRFIAKALKSGLLPWTKAPVATRPGRGGGLFGRR